MMWRVLAAMDFITVMEAHFGVIPPVPAVGLSTGPHFAIGVWAWKFDKQCMLGPIPINTPPCLGHDAGILRPHVLIDLSPLPPPPAPPAVPLNSAVTSAGATLCSALKPTFSSSRDLRNGGPGALPVSTEALPFLGGLILSGNVPCGIGGPHMGIPMVPTQLQDWSGLTLGDVIGGLVNMAAETFFQAALDTVGALLPFGDAILKFGGKALGDFLLSNGLGIIVGYGSATGLPTWPSGDMISRPVQQAVDNAVQSLTGDASPSASATPASSGSSSAGASSPSGSGSSGAGSGTGSSGGAPPSMAPSSVYPTGWSPFGTVA